MKAVDRTIVLVLAVQYLALAVPKKVKFASENRTSSDYESNGNDNQIVEIPAPLPQQLRSSLDPRNEPQQLRSSLDPRNEPLQLRSSLDPRNEEEDIGTLSNQGFTNIDAELCENAIIESKLDKGELKQEADVYVYVSKVDEDDVNAFCNGVQFTKVSVNRIMRAIQNAIEKEHEKQKIRELMNTLYELQKENLQDKKQIEKLNGELQIEEQENLYQCGVTKKLMHTATFMFLFVFLCDFMMFWTDPRRKLPVEDFSLGHAMTMSAFRISEVASFLIFLLHFFWTNCRRSPELPPKP